MERVTAYFTGEVDVQGTVAWMIGLPDPGVELRVGIDVIIDLRAEPVAGVVELVRAHALGGGRRQSLQFKSPAWSLDVDRPVLADDQDDLGAMATLRSESISPGTAFALGERFDADVVICDADGEDGATTVHFALLRLTETRRAPPPDAGWGRAVLEREWIRLGAFSPGDRAWETAIFQLVAAIRRGEAPPLSDPPPPPARLPGTRASAPGAAPQAPAPRHERGAAPLAVPSYLQQPPDAASYSPAAPGPSCHAQAPLPNAPRAAWPPAPPAPASGAAPAADPFSRPAVIPALSAATEPIDLAKLRGILANPTPFAGATSPERLAELRAEAAGMDETMLPTTPSSGGEDVDETMMLPSAALRAGISTACSTRS